MLCARLYARVDARTNLNWNVVRSTDFADETFSQFKARIRSRKPVTEHEFYEENLVLVEKTPFRPFMVCIASVKPHKWQKL